MLRPNTVRAQNPYRGFPCLHTDMRGPGADAQAQVRARNSISTKAISCGLSLTTLCSTPIWRL
jgi:hypothetical protein